METKHTPGPWEVQPKWDERTNGAAIYARNAGNLIASALYLGGTAEPRANAALMAAAPDMLAVLEIINEIDGAYGISELTEPQRDQLHDALRKARGTLIRA